MGSNKVDSIYCHTYFRFQTRYTGQVIKVNVTVLSLDYVISDDEISSAWIMDKTNYEEIVMAKLLEEEFKALLTELQLQTYKHCIVNGMTYVEYAKQIGLHEATIRSSIRAIRKKAKKFLNDTTISEKICPL